MKDNQPDSKEVFSGSNKDFTKELQQLAKDSIKGDKKSYKLFLNKITPHIRRYVYKQWWGDSHSHEDLIQDTLIAIHTSLNTYDYKRPILPWVQTIVMYKVADFSRKFSRWNLNETDGENIETFSDDYANNTEDSLEHLDYIEHALATLPDNQAHIIRMLKIQGLSIQEVSDKTGISVAAVKTYAHRGYKKILEFRDKN